ncbi:MAG: 50S ribosomal protein L17 [Candidatus Yanofskybacteria bacterium RIFOXYD1_FULL_44_17]|uniref:50S ribosomal protein L17 n=1 Tax=Candidatus Yanofskybacteria bacterium GW2011_GWE2_40_11 TaxID=1619033 RepID=A0A0G0QL88_9BACT|nr:MAG: 50S ribosomal protein L17 [Candidatus Yanofskybacteria bacterium GW2011_GWE2_40_11]OGN36215.1 MAG: 50S ribosomal protein L17 [Candidatus Yanofskybacteria bacterium RIFOXYA2_FULL_45_28]OGN36931.1 MAG: 50S ribosomal protein L17 [Candidatus Yanofskybacteria bacterium RIFOXYA1_FULL_44_17]OGN38374.1 MAG: 50S ribosomal protein L17 [Candidatus Yanofskybacteria bacterium RIFOXYC1_FULL_44_16]OGN38553.1 MAG: 50S ribosomal protein L17 [Candidatus Yanofskybacteria bacterium RIFOXYB2_FULL_44_18]OGN
MRRGKHRKFGRESIQRHALYKALATALIDHGRIKTTVAKAKTISSYVSKLVTKAKSNSVAAKREMAKDLGAKAIFKLFTEIAPKFKDHKGGYTRITKLGDRKSDAASMVFIEFTFKEAEKPAK